MTDLDGGSVLRPLGRLAPRRGEIWRATDLPRTPELSPRRRREVADYLAGCPSIFSWMGYTHDEIGDKFSVPGGSAVMCDGVYYWRSDASEYIREYGIPIPDDAVRHFESRSWVPPEFDRAEIIRLDHELQDLLGRNTIIG